MHLGGAGIGEADVNAARDQGPHQTFRTIHPFHSRSLFFKSIEDQSFPAHSVKGSEDIAAMAATVVSIF
jgi:hypothetical protein